MAIQTCKAAQKGARLINELAMAIALPLHTGPSLSPDRLLHEEGPGMIMADVQW